jgi:hypothetical protein
MRTVDLFVRDRTGGPLREAKIACSFDGKAAVRGDPARPGRLLPCDLKVVA